MTNDLEKYNRYTADDFLDDADFIRLVKLQRAEDIARWSVWLESAPANRTAFDEAYASLLGMLSFVRILPPSDEARQSWEAVGKKLDALEKRRINWRIGRLAAAAALLLVTLSSAVYWYYNSRITIATDYGQQRQIVLPDQSTVLLNAHSSLTYYRAWNWRHKREVWLSGEALFDVRPRVTDGAASTPGETFTANAGDWSVAVLGTRFTIRERRNTVMVALLNGKISVTDLRHPGPALILQPGESVSSEDSVLHPSPTSRLPNPPQAWAEHKILASGMTVGEIITNYEDTYGYHIVLGNPAQAAKRIDGTLSLESEEGVIYSLANILNAYIHREGKTIYLQPK